MLGTKLKPALPVEDRLKSIKTNAMGPEQRIEPRRATQSPAILIINGDNRHHCIIRDLSRFGARITLDDFTGETSRAILVFASGKRPCRIAWRRGNEAGLAF